MISPAAAIGSWFAEVRQHRMDILAALILLVIVSMIVVNALYLQPGPHPAPFFAVKTAVRGDAPIGSIAAVPRPRPAEAGVSRTPAARSRVDIVSDLQRELLRRGFYDGPVDGVNGPKTDAAIRDFEQHAGVKLSGEPNEDMLRTVTQSTAKTKAPATAQTARRDPLGDLIAPPAKRVMAVQRALSDFAYAQLKPTGTLGPETKTAIEKFERERRMPVTGLISDRLIRELAAATGRPLE